ncbi:MAG: hypothetical protein AAF420_15835, partial [Pseudomonadota bacterium]
VNVGEAVVGLFDLDSIEVSAQVATGDVGQLIAARELRFEFEDESYQLKLKSLVENINTRSRDREARLVFADAKALPGAAGRVRWRDERPHLPAKLLVERDGELGVFIAEGDVARFIALPNASVGSATPVSVAASTLFVTQGYFGLRDGAAIKVRN